MKYTCSLCGGKLKDGICTECGMNNQKSDEMYRDCLNRSKYDHASMESMSHVHTEQGVKQYKQPVLNENKRAGNGKAESPGQLQRPGPEPKLSGSSPGTRPFGSRQGSDVIRVQILKI